MPIKRNETARRVVVVTGGSAGVGRAIAREFAGCGAAVALLARGRNRLEEAERELRNLGVPALSIPADVADPGQVEQAAETVERELGPIDVWVNNAMTTVFAPFDDITPEEYKRATEVTYLGTVYGTLSALRRMKRRNAGVIVQVGSSLSYRGIPLQAPYCGAKHAIRGFTDSLRCELLHDDSSVRLTMVHLPAMNTPQFNWCRSKLPNHPQPVPPIYQPEVAARAVVWAADHDRREVNVGYPSTAAIWGNKFLPSLGDWYLAKTGYESQQTNEPVPKDRSDNLFEPAPGDFAAHGDFDERSTDLSWHLWATMHRSWLLAAAGAVLSMFALNAVARRR